MKQTRFHFKSMTIGLLLISPFCSCVDNERDLFQEPEKLPKEDYFDFNMNQSLAVNIDYGFKEDYAVLFEIFDQNPFVVEEENSSVKKKIISVLPKPSFMESTSFIKASKLLKYRMKASEKVIWTERGLSSQQR